MSLKASAAMLTVLALGAMGTSCAPTGKARARGNLFAPSYGRNYPGNKPKTFVKGGAGGRMPLIGEKAPAFRAETTLGAIEFPGAYRGSWVVFFSHPGDFTPVCTTEFMTLATMKKQFDAIDCRLLGLSVDSKPSHIAWVRNIEGKIEYEGMKGVVVSFPVVADPSMQVARRYGMIHPGRSDTRTVRAVFVIDPKGTVRSILCYPSEAGRNLQEVLRLVVALQTADQHACATPANWQPGDEVILPLPGTCNDAAKRLSERTEGYRCLDWYFCLMELAEEKLDLPPSMK